MAVQKLGWRIYDRLDEAYYPDGDYLEHLAAEAGSPERLRFVEFFRSPACAAVLRGLQEEEGQS